MDVDLAARGPNARHGRRHGVEAPQGDNMVVAACSQHAFAREGQRRDVSTGDTHRLVAEILDGGRQLLLCSRVRGGFEVGLPSANGRVSAARDKLRSAVTCEMAQQSVWQQATYNSVSRYSDGENSA